MTNVTQAFEWWLENQRDEGIKVVLKRALCPCCDGTGTTWHGWHSDDACTYTGDEWAELDYETRDNYAAGVYDKPCPECKGNKVVEILNEDHTDPEVVASWHEYLDGARECDDIERQERMMGA